MRAGLFTAVLFQVFPFGLAVVWGVGLESHRSGLFRKGAGPRVCGVDSRPGACWPVNVCVGDGPQSPDPRQERPLFFLGHRLSLSVGLGSDPGGPWPFANVLPLSPQRRRPRISSLHWVSARSFRHPDLLSLSCPAGDRQAAEGSWTEWEGSGTRGPRPSSVITLLGLR